MSVRADCELPELSALESTPEAPTDLLIRRVAMSPFATLEGQLFSGRAQVGTRRCLVRCSTEGSTTWLSVAGAAGFALRHGSDAGASKPARHSATIEVAARPGAPPAAVREALLGPALALELARRDTFLLHASAVLLRSGRAVGFLGRSGVGKSTLAALLAARPGVRRVADDALAIALVRGLPVALTGFPQLKLTADEMAAIAALPERLELAALYRLRPAAPESSPRLGPPLPPGRAAAESIRHTMAARLFGDELLVAHLSTMSALAARLPVRALWVPRRLDVGAEIAALLVAEDADHAVAPAPADDGIEGVV